MNPVDIKDDAELITFRKSFHSDFIYTPPSNFSGENKGTMSRTVITIIKHSSAAVCNLISVMHGRPRAMHQWDNNLENCVVTITGCFFQHPQAGIMEGFDRVNIGVNKNLFSGLMCRRAQI